MLGLVQSALLAGCFLFALALGEWRPAGGLVLTFAGLLVASLSVLLLTPRPVKPAGVPEALAVILLWWALVPLATGTAFAIGLEGYGAVDGWYEAVSCLSTSGQTAEARAMQDWPASLQLLRAVLHLMGALVSLVMVTSVFSALNLGGPGIHRTALFTLPEGDFFKAVPRVIIAAASYLLILLGFSTLLILATGVPLFRALAEAASVVSSGVVSPIGGVTPPASMLHALVLILTLGAVTAGLSVALDLRDKRPGRILRDPELFALLVIWATVATFLMVLGTRIVPAIGMPVSYLATSGLPFAAPRDLVPVPPAALILCALIGGSALSAAGGIKLARIVVLSVRAGLEADRLVFKGAVTSFRFRGRRQSPRVIIGVWVYLVAYSLTLLGGAFALALAGFDFTAALVAACGALSNTGPLVSSAVSPAEAPAQLVLIVLMLAGRLEVIALLPAFSASFWRS